MMNLTELIIRHEKNPLKLTLLFSLPIFLVFVVLTCTFAIRDVRSHRRHLEFQLKDSAKAYFDQVMLTRKWNAMHEGVYVEINQKTQPNPYLEDVERDITTLNGKRLTKINPAYMTRQISKIAEESGYYKFSLSSLTPINPSNKADEWEVMKLKSFKKGKKEAFTFMELDGVEYFRYIAPLRVDEECLRCHGKHGYKVGDIKGGLSINIPVHNLLSMNRELLKRSIAVHVTISIVALLFIVTTVWVFSNRLRGAITREVESEKLQSAIHVAGAAAHELRQPMTIISGFAEILKDKTESGESIDKEMGIIVGQCKRMNSIITKMLNVTRYKLRSYSEDAEIFDFEVDNNEEEG